MTLPRVLMVDDDMTVLVSLTRVLAQQCKLDVVLENTATRALDRLNASTFDLLVCDLRLPGVSGSQLLEMAARRWPKMRRALLTGAMVDWSVHADATLLKGTDPDAIVGTICRLARFDRVVP